MQNNVQNDEEITLKINYYQNQRIFKCKLTDILMNYIIEFARLSNLNYLSLYFLYNGSNLLPDQLKKPISEIITRIDKNYKIMTLLSYELENDEINRDEIIIILLSIESENLVKLTGKRGEKIKDIIKNSIKPSFTFDFNWLSFKYNGNEIDIEQNFDNICN